MVQSCSHPSGRRPKKIDEILLKTGEFAIVAFQGGKTMAICFFFGRTKKTASSCKKIMATNYEENNRFM